MGTKPIRGRAGLELRPADGGVELEGITHGEWRSLGLGGVLPDHQGDRGKPGLKWPRGRHQCLS